MSAALALLFASPKISALLFGFIVDKLVTVLPFTKGDLFGTVLKGSFKGAASAYRGAKSLPGQIRGKPGGIVPDESQPVQTKNQKKTQSKKARGKPGKGK